MEDFVEPASSQIPQYVNSSTFLPVFQISFFAAIEMFTELVEFCWGCVATTHSISWAAILVGSRLKGHDTQNHSLQLDLAVIVSTIGYINTKIPKNTKSTKTHELETWLGSG